MDKQEYITNKIEPIMQNLLFQLMCEKPENPDVFIMNWLKKASGQIEKPLTPKEKEELEMLRKEVQKLKEENR